MMNTTRYKTDPAKWKRSAMRRLFPAEGDNSEIEKCENPENKLTGPHRKGKEQTEVNRTPNRKDV